MEPATAAAGTRWIADRRLGAYATAGLLAVLALAVSLSTIGHESLWFDEGVTLRVGRYAREPWVEHLTTREPFWALYYALIRPVIEVTDNLILLRLPSALAAAGTVGLTYLVGRRLVGRRAALAGALVLVPHGFLLQYAQEARGYATAAFLMVACMWAFVLACERPGWRRWVAYALLGVLAIYAHFFAAFVIAAQFLALAFRGRAWIRAHWRQAAVAFAVIGVAALPLATWLMAAEQTRRFVRPITPDRIIAAFAWFGGANVMPHDPPYYLLSAAAAVAMALAVVHLVARATSKAWPWRPVLLAAWLALPLLVSLAISMAVKPVFTYRYLIVSLPALALAIGLLLLEIRGWRWRSAASIVVAGVLAVGAWSVLMTRNKPDWNGAAAFVLERAEPGDVVIMQPGWQWTPMSYAMEQARTGPIPNRRITKARPNHAAAALDRLRRTGSRIWLVVFDYRARPLENSYPFLDLMEEGRERVLDEYFYDVRVMLFEPAP